MLNIFNLLSIFLIFLSAPLLASGPTLTMENLPVSQRIKKSLPDSPYVLSEVETLSQDQQKLDYLIAGLHKKACSYAMVKLSQYERFQEFIDFVTKSEYDEKKERIRLYLSHSLLPFNMILDFKIKRIKGTGVYPFQFDAGFLKGLKGMIHVSDYKGRCLFATTAKWQGPDSGIPDSVFSFFSQALGKLAMERLFRVSETL